MKKNNLLSILYFSLIFLALWLIMQAVSPKVFPGVTNYEQLNTFDFENRCGRIYEYVGEKYNGKLLQPEEIDSNIPDDHQEVFKKFITYRYIVPVKDGVNYGIMCEKSDYALNVFVDGVLVAKTGNVADNEEDFVPTSAAYTSYFTGKGDKAEIVIQQANFCHSKHQAHTFCIGPAEKISEFVRMYLLENCVFASILLTSWLMNLGLFIFFNQKKEVFWFSCVCFAATINKCVPKITAYVLPNMNWNLSHRLETCSLILIIMFAVLYVATIFREYINRKAVIFSTAVSVLFFIIFAFTPSLFYTRCNEIAILTEFAVIVPLFLILVIRVVKNLRKLSFTRGVFLIGLLLFIIFAIHLGIEYVISWTVSLMRVSIGISIFAFFNSLALVLDFRTTNDMLQKAETRERELAHTNEILTRLDKVREVFLADLSHELKTPLTVIASNAVLSSKMVSMGKANDMTVSKLDSIEREAVRLGKMVERLKNSAEGQYNEIADNMNISKVLSASADFCNPLCARNGNTLSLSCEKDIYAFASANTLFHCLYNLISNATKHCSNSVIDLICIRNEGSVVISVQDHGEGMDDEAKKHAFDRGFSEDSSTGIGLPLCRELIENEGGMLCLEDTPGGGLTVSFSLRVGKAPDENEAD